MPGITTSLTPSAIGSANIAGLGSGIDFNATVDKLIAVEKRKVTLLKNQQQLETNKQTALNTLNGNLTTLRTAAQALADGSNFFSNTSTLTSSVPATDPATILTVTPDSTAAAGTHTIQVTALATAEKFVSTAGVIGATSSTTPLNLSGSFQITGQANTAQTVTVNSTDSLQDIVNHINTLNSGSNATKVTASILTVNATAGSEDFRLVLEADNTGAAKGKIVLNSVNSSLVGTGSLKNLNFNPTSAQKTLPADSNLTVDGVTGIVRESNSVTDVLPGFTLDLLKAEVGTTVTIKTAIDQAAIKSKIKSFVDAFNTVKTFINKQMVFDVKTQTNGILASDATVRSINSRLTTNILQSIPALPSGKDSMLLFGVAPDSTGKLVIDDAKLTSSLSTDAAAVRGVFAATGTGSVSSLEFIGADVNTVSGTYAVNIATAAAKAHVTGTTNLTAGFTGTDKVTVTDGAGRQAAVTLTNPTALTGTGGIVDLLNTEFAKTVIEVRGLNSALQAVSGGVATNATTFSNLLGQVVNTNDTISITGTKRDGSSVNSTFTVLDPTKDTLGNLLSTIQVAFGQQVAASVDSSGNIVIKDNNPGDSLLSLKLTANNESVGSTLNPGVETTSLITEGRYALNLTAAASNGFLKLQGTSFGPGSNFTVKQTTTDLLGLGGSISGADFFTNVANGADVVGTIGGLAATGSGQVLSGSSGNVSGLTLQYTGNTTGAVGNLAVSLGSGFLFSNLLDTFTNSITGLVQSDITSSKTTFNDIQTRIDNMNARIGQDRVRLTKQFQQMEILINNFKVQGNFLSQQVGFNIKKG